MKSRLSAIALVLLAAAARPASAQLPVIDQANLYQTVLIAERTWQQYDELRREYETVLRMSRGLGSLEGYRLPTIPIARHDASRWEYGRPWIQALNSGDPAGAAYLPRPSHCCVRAPRRRASRRRHGGCSSGSTPPSRSPTPSR